MRIVTFNIHHGTVAKDGPVDPDRLAATCAAFDADVLALQEVDVGTCRAKGVDLAEAVADACAMDHVFGPSRRFPGGWYGNALFVRGGIDAWSVTALPRLPTWKWWQERRTAIVATVTPAALAGRSLTVVATHLAVAQAVSEVQLDHLLTHLVPPSTGPDLNGAVAARPSTVVLGDLNRFPSTVEPAAVAAGLTYVAHGPTNPVLPKRRLVIDHVLLSPDLTLVSSHVRSTDMSDHAALLIDVRPAEDVIDAEPAPGATSGEGR